MSTPAPVTHAPSGPDTEPRPARLWLYDRLDRLGLRNYRLKIMAMAFVGTHIPLIALSLYVATQSSTDWRNLLWTLAVTLGATLAGTAATLAVLHHLLRPVSAVASALRGYRGERRVEPLPRRYTDEVGSLLRDTAETIDHLERNWDVLEHVDPVTNLPNGKRALQLIERRLARGGDFAVAVLRVEGLTRIAEAFDAVAAERVVRTLTERLREALGGEQRLPGVERRGDVLMRTGWDEFAILLDGAAGPALPGTADADADADAAGAGVRAADRVRRMAQDCSAELDVAGSAVAPQFRIGVALGPQDARNAAALVDYARAAAAQAAAAAPVVLHSQDARDATRARFLMEEELRRALREDEFELHYQPIVDTKAGRVAGAEALVRWRHPERGLVFPDTFIPVAEASGLIDDLGLWVLRAACAQSKRWEDEGRALRIAVNLSARQFADSDLVDHVREALEQTRLAPERLGLELTETAAMTDIERTVRVLETFRERGVEVALDDFGTGYASMSYLRTLPFAKLKVDREFVTAVHETPTSQAICNALIALARGLNLRVLAEGTETESEIAYLRDAGCDLFQGYHYSRPVPAADFASASDRIALDLVRTAMGDHGTGEAERRVHAA